MDHMLDNVKSYCGEVITLSRSSITMIKSVTGISDWETAEKYN